MNMKTMLAVGLAVVLGGVAVGVVVLNRQAERLLAQQTVKAERQGDLEQAGNRAPRAAAPAAPEQLSPEQDVAPVAGAPPPALAAVTPQAQKSPASTDEPIPEKTARAMLRFVGTDPLAEEVWVQAINDPRLSSHARKELIEDLNEDGFPDPHNVTADDLPLILSRIEIIERLAPNAMDKANSAAFQEAHKDLMNMVARLVQP